MTLRHWLWILAGLLTWAALVILWSTSPDICDQPQARTSHHCEGR